MFVFLHPHPSLPQSPSPPPSTNVETDKRTVAVVFVTVWQEDGDRVDCFMSQSQANRTLCSLVSCHYCTNHTAHTHSNTRLLFSICLAHINEMRQNWDSASSLPIVFPLFECWGVQTISMPFSSQTLTLSTHTPSYEWISLLYTTMSVCVTCGERKSKSRQSGVTAASLCKGPERQGRRGMGQDSRL